MHSPHTLLRDKGVSECLKKAPEKLNQAREQNVRQDPFLGIIELAGV